MLKNIEEENAPARRAFADHIYIFAKGLIVIGRVDGGIGIALYIVVKGYPFMAYNLFEILPGPLFVCWPFLCQVGYNHRGHGPIITLLKIIYTYRIHPVNR